MITKVKSCGIYGIDGFIIEVETDISNGMPSFDVVGLPDTAVKESKERVRSSLQNCGFDYPAQKITVNLSPANIKKEGTAFDLPIAVGILMSTGQITIDDLDGYAILGELTLSGELLPVRGALGMVMECVKNGIQNVILPLHKKLKKQFVT